MKNYSYTLGKPAVALGCLLTLGAALPLKATAENPAQPARQHKEYFPPLTW